MMVAVLLVVSPGLSIAWGSRLQAHCNTEHSMHKQPALCVLAVSNKGGCIICSLSTMVDKFTSFIICNREISIFVFTISPFT